MMLSIVGLSSFLGADPWCNPFVIRSELGWLLSGYARALKSLALRRSRMWCRADDDWYKSFFLHHAHHGIEWAGRSADLLASWGVEDWPAVKSVYPQYKSYGQYLDGALGSCCSSAMRIGLEAHQGQVPYTLFQSSMSDLLHVARCCNLPWRVQLQMYGWCRVRAGLPCLRHINGKHSRARHQQCIFCGFGVRNGTVHSICFCKRWVVLRTELASSLGSPLVLSAQQLCLAALGTHPRLPGFAAALALCDAIDCAATTFWRCRSAG